jgi:hypothetical protein
MRFSRNKKAPSIPMKREFLIAKFRMLFDESGSEIPEKAKPQLNEPLSQYLIEGPPSRAGGRS